MTPDLDTLTALLAAATRFPHENDSYGGCVSCVWSVPYTDDEYERVPFPCPASLLPALIAAARREAGLREALTKLLVWADQAHDEEDTSRLLDHLERHDVLDAARALLHDSAWATGDEVGEP